MNGWLFYLVLLAPGQEGAPGSRPGLEAVTQGTALELREGDRVVMIGDAFLERDHDLGQLETTLTARYPDRAITFRNLGWTGDTVWGDSRAAFETAKEGFERRAAIVKQLNPTVLVVAYGMNESFAGEAGLPRFEEGLKAMLASVATPETRVVLISPIVHENLGPPLPDPNSHNRDLVLYRDFLKQLAEERGYGFVDLIQARIGDGTRPERVVPTRETIDGIHLNPLGYNQAAITLGEKLAPARYPLWALNASLGTDGVKMGDIVGTQVLASNPTDRGLAIRLLDHRLPNLPEPAETPARLKVLDRTLSVTGLASGTYALTIDGKEILRSPASDWAKGVRFVGGPEYAQLEALRRALVEKNRQVFYRWRPQNETYIFGFRKHEQGQNAADIPRFDPLAVEKEAEIARLRIPVAHTYELIRVEESSK